jgi:hypothetical protein
MKETNGKEKAARTVSRVQHQDERTMETKRTIQRRKQEDETTAVDSRWRERLRKKMRRGRWESSVQSYI